MAGARGAGARARAGPEVSIILPVHNAELWLDACLQSVWQQDFEGLMELSVFDDASQDKSMAILEKWKLTLESSGIHVIIGGHNAPSPRGVGYSKNQAIAQSSGSFLCFLDADDTMMPQRVRLQHQAAVQHPTSIIGCQVTRDPPNSTERYTRWINGLRPHQLLTQRGVEPKDLDLKTQKCVVPAGERGFLRVAFSMGREGPISTWGTAYDPDSEPAWILRTMEYGAWVFTSNGPTVVMPTWFCSRTWFSHVGPFDEGGKGVPEDLLLFYNHLREGGGVFRVDRRLLLYRYHPNAATHSVLETTIWTHRVQFLEEQVLPRWKTFTIWNAGKQGRRLYRSLTEGARSKVTAFCDVDENKIKKGFYCYEDSQERPKPRIPVLHFRAAQPPFVICVKLDLTGGAFEDNLRSLHLQEGLDFVHFS